MAAHWWLANVGLALLAGGFAWRAAAGSGSQWMLMAGGLCAGAGAYCFAYNLWRTLDGRPAALAVEQAAAWRGLPVRHTE